MNIHSVASSNNHYSLNNHENFHSFLEYSSNEILDKYILLNCEYLKFFIENITIKNKHYFKFIMIRGLETITHVFHYILFYSKNLDMAYYHSQKSFYYYVEFIGQISDDQNTYLQLSSRDATIYVYKKTIFEINNENKRLFNIINNDTIQKLDCVQLQTQMYKHIIVYVMNILDNNIINKDLLDFFTYRFEIICNKINSVILNYTELKTIYFFIENINTKNISFEKYLDILDLFSKKICKTKSIIHEKKMQNKFLTKEIDDILMEQTSEKFIQWLFA